MQSFGETNIEIVKKDERTLVFNLSQILRWYRSDFYQNKLGLVGMVYCCLIMGDEDEKGKLILEYFDKVMEPEMKMDENGLSVWDRKASSMILKLKKGKRFKINWNKYDWGTNAK